MGPRHDGRSTKRPLLDWWLALYPEWASVQAKCFWSQLNNFEEVPSKRKTTRQREANQANGRATYLSGPITDPRLFIRKMWVGKIPISAERLERGKICPCSAFDTTLCRCYTAFSNSPNRQPEKQAKYRRAAWSALWRWPCFGFGTDSQYSYPICSWPEEDTGVLFSSTFVILE